MLLLFFHGKFIKTIEKKQALTLPEVFFDDIRSFREFIFFEDFVNVVSQRGFIFRKLS